MHTTPDVHVTSYIVETCCASHTGHETAREQQLQKQRACTRCRCPPLLPSIAASACACHANGNGHAQKEKGEWGRTESGGIRFTHTCLHTHVKTHTQARIRTPIHTHIYAHTFTHTHLRTDGSTARGQLSMTARIAQRTVPRKLETSPGSRADTRRSLRRRRDALLRRARGLPHRPAVPRARARRDSTSG